MTTYQRWLLVKITPYPIFFLIGGWLYIIVERGIMGEASIYPSTGNPYNTLTSLVTISITTILMGLLFGFIEETFFKSRLKSWPFVFKLVTKTVIYILTIVVSLLLSSWPNNAYNMGAPLMDPAVIETVMAFIWSFTFLSVIIYAGAIISTCLFVAEIIDYLGLEVVGNFFTGKYNKAVTEERIFMFLDMKGSTTIAEQLGNASYYDLVNQYYADMTGPIINTQGQIYQYVGDEIVISWKLKEGLLNANCIRCFFLIRDAIGANASRYHARYGLTPEFKAGVHFGAVTRGQIGLIKKEMLFSGDVLNTTARVQGLSNELQSTLLVTSSLRDLLSGAPYDFEAKGAFALRGRTKKEELLAVTSP